MLKHLTVVLVVFFMQTGVVLGGTATKDQQSGKTSADATANKAADVTWQQKTDEGYRQLEAGETETALASFEEALQMNPRGAAAKTGKGIILAGQGKLQEAEALLRQALILNPEPTRTHYELGRIYQQQGDFQRSVTEYKLGIENFRESHP